MKKTAFILIFICVFFSGCYKQMYNSTFEPPVGTIEIELAYANMSIDEFTEKFNASVINEDNQIDSWTEENPGIVKHSFNEHVILNLGQAPNPQRLTSIPSLYVNIADISKIEDFTEIVYCVLKAGDENVTLKQAQDAVQAITPDQAELIIATASVVVKEATVNKILLYAAYVNNEVQIWFYDAHE